MCRILNKITMNRLNIFVVGLFFALVMFTGCDKKENEEFCSECKEFCLYANVEDFHKTAPFINEYLSSLTSNWSDEQKLQNLTNWLNSMSCIISAKLKPEMTDYSKVPTFRSTPLQPPLGIIAILLDENGTTKEILLEVGLRYPYESDSLVATGYRYEKPREVRVLTQPLATTSMVFDFINLFDFEVLLLSGIFYSTTTHTEDNIQSILSSKPYIAAIGSSWGHFSPTFYSMENKSYQADWLKFIDDYQLIETNPFGPYGAWITFLVPVGKEREWAAKFENYDLVSSVDLNWGFKGM